MRDNRRGLALVMSCFLVALVAAYGSATMVRSLTEQRTAQRYLQRSSAFQAAEAGLDSAIATLRSDTNWSGVGYTSTLKGGYDVAVTTLSPTLRRLTVTGYAPSNNPAAYGYQRRQVEATLSVPAGGPFDYSLFATGTIVLNSNAKVDSYDSRSGFYYQTCAPSINSDPAQRPEDCKQGDVGSNAIATGTVTLTSNARIDGDAAIGPGGNTNTAIVRLGNSLIAGSRQSLLAKRDLTLEAFPSGTATEPLLLTSNQQQTLSAGTYRYTNVELNSNSSVKVTGDATIYVEGNFQLGGNTKFVTTNDTCAITLYVNGNVELNSNSLVSAGDKPTNLKLFVTSGGTLAMNANSRFFGAVKAPLSAMSLNSNAILYGAAIAQQFQVNSNAKVHYDLALGSGGGAGNSGLVQLLSWREL